MKRKPEYIVSAAVHYKDGKSHSLQPINIDTGIVVTGYRHVNCTATLLILLGNEYEMELDNRSSQGFITSNNRFVDRKEGFRIAWEQGQVWHNFCDPNNPDQELTSEDLY
jgi:hypothetical protein